MLLHKYLSFLVYILVQSVNLISCNDGSTLAFAIDDTGSMYDDIYQVKMQAKAIMDIAMNSKTSDTKDMVLVTINDPDKKFCIKTNSTAEFLEQISKVKVLAYSGGDCPEMSLSGMERALQASRQGSYLYVFTDAAAKDYEKAGRIKNLCQEKQSQVIFVLTGDCAKYAFTRKLQLLYEKMYRVYYDIAEACSGQVFRVEKGQVGSTLEVLKVLLRATTSVLKWANVRPSHRYIAVPFVLDEKAEYALVSTSGSNVQLRITTIGIYEGPVPKTKTVLWNDNSKALELIDPKPGTYYAWVKGDSSVSVVVHGRTDFTFDYGFSILEPKSMNDATKQPIAGAKQHVSINVTDPDNSVNIKTLQILDIKNKDALITELPLRKRSDGLYITDSFVSPNGTFRIAVKGVIKKTNKPIVRNSRTNVNPIFVDLTPQSAPVVNIAEGAVVDVNYGSNVTLTCNVRAHPPPKIEWYTANGDFIPTNSSEKAKPDYISYLSLSQVKHGETYVCRSSNRLGRGEKSVRVNVLPVFTKNGNKGNEKFTPKFGKDVKLPCEIDSYLPITRKWFKSGIEVVPSDRNIISPDGSELTLKAVSVEMQGTYTCEATLNADPTVKDARLVEVIIPGLLAPEIVSATTAIEDRNLSATCRVKGVPKPAISWQFKPKGSAGFHTIPGSEEVLNIPEIKLSDTGVYKCIAQNVLNKTERDLNVVVEEKPIITSTILDHFGLEGDLVMKILCNTTGFPEPTIVWEKGGKPLIPDTKYVVKDGNLYIKTPVSSDTGDYTCKASNKKGSDSKTFQVYVTDTFTDDDNYNGEIHDVITEKKKLKTIKCDVEDTPIGSVRWYKDGVLTPQKGNVYTIEVTTVYDEGNYTCRVNTGEGSKSETYIVMIGYAPVFEDYRSPQTINWRNSAQKLDCSADSQPIATYMWYHNGRLIKAGEDLREIHITDWGEYSCKVNNVFGNIQKSFTVTTEGCLITQTASTKNQPLASDKNTPTWTYSISNSDIFLEEHEEIKLSCPTNSKSANSFKIAPEKKEVIAKCVSRDEFTVAGKKYKYSELQCNNKVEPLVQPTGEQCFGRNSEMIRVGFPVNGFIEAYRVCYDTHLNVPIYANTTSPALRIGSGANVAQFEWSPTPELGDLSPGDWEPEGSCKCCYTKGALLDSNQLPFGPAQAAIFKNNLNSVPVWNPTCDSDKSPRISWQSFSEEMREISLIYDNWSSWTGASDYRYTDDGLVPRYLWKVVKFEGEVSVTVFVNGAARASDVRCGGACDSLTESDAFLYCCDAREFQDKFGVPIDTFMT